MATHNEFIQEPIAIVGSACRFPAGSSSPSKLWELLRQPRDVLKEFNPDRLNLQRFYHPDGDTHGSTDVQNKSYLLEEDSRFFDAPFFGISPSEASGMDPQQRLLLEVVYEAFESAGVTLDQLRSSLTSVHVGVMTADYANIQLRDLETIPKYAATGMGNSILSNRISYIFDLKGPSETIDTACSSSLVALHNAARGLLNGDSEMAIAAGVNLIFDPASYITESKLHMLSPDSRSRMWDKSANGYARGEGVAAVFLKPLSRALRDGDHIEGLLRGTGVNSDGQSPGITMPFAPAQAALIRQTYRRVGLDPVKDRPQYFECHGTGTPAGDPVEARAISESLLASHGGDLAAEKLIYVGSIKTVVGHLEGCAGLAGVIKVLLALKNRTIPPNLHFNELNPAITPYYGPLQIATAALPWPELPAGAPARASVNSFGFGGTNAHAIIERFDNDACVNGNAQGQRHYEDNQDSDLEEGILGPLLFSAVSGASLLGTVRAYLQHLRHHPELDLRDLSWTLQTRRSTHRVRAHFSGTSRDSILEGMAEWVTSNEKAPSTQVGYQPRLVNPSEVPGILGVFTGQGAQWPTMGRELIRKSPLFRKTIQACEDTLQALPIPDVPEWSLVQELMADGSSSRLSEAAIAQPLCTAVQIALVDLLAASGITFDAVVGHSSGEIAATYAAGIITLRGAIQIAYFRGLYARLALGAAGVRGGMLAGGMSLEKALQFCSLPEFQGRIQVAASNAPQSVTLSGDVDAIHEAKQRLDNDNIFARQLKVDTAYHSHHMQPCVEPYLQSLLACDIEIRRPNPGCVWNSSVRGDTELLRRGDLSSLKGPYWVANMVQTVLFSKAIQSSIWHGGPWDLAIEVGPHPALKGPVEQTIKAVYNSVPNYTGTLKRNDSDVAAFSAAVGTAWAQLGPSFVDFNGYRRAFFKSQPPAPKVIKDLPSYSWDHDKVYWRESRISRRYRTSRDTGHELLGRRTPDDNDHELRWRNVLKLSEMPWLQGHKVLDEVLLPAAAYVSIAFEAGKRLAVVGGKARPIRLLEVDNVEIHRPVVVPDNKYGVETLFTMRLLDHASSTATDGMLQAEFSYYVCNDESVGYMAHTCSGTLSVYLENMPSGKQEECFPPRATVPPNLADVDGGQVYSMFDELGLHYSGAFRAITESHRCLDYATATGSWPEGSLSNDYIIHPAMLDVAFQSVFVARAHPASRQITSIFLPAHIDRVRVTPSAQMLQSSLSDGHVIAEFEAWVVAQTTSSLSGDLNICSPETGQPFLQVEGFVVKTVGEPDADHDRPVFAKTVWARDVSLGLADPVRDAVKDIEALHKTEVTERFALFYMRRVVEEIRVQDRTGFQWYHDRMFEAFEHRLAAIRDGQNTLLPSRWLADEPSVIEDILAKHSDWIDLQLIRAVGENLGHVREEAELLEVMNKDDMLNRVYMDSNTFLINDAIADVLRQITFKFPRCNILEVGAGTGGTTWSVLNALDDAYDSYTYTDISSGFFQNATRKFSNFAHKMVFKTLDAEKAPAAQGFVEHAYDVIIAANVLHATRSLRTTLRNVWSLLRPGGYLVMMEATGEQSLRGHLVFGGFPGWWLSSEEGRRFGPVVSAAEWDVVLSDTGFSRTTPVMHDLADADKHTTSLIVGQAVNDAWLRLRDPLSFIHELRPLGPTEPLLLVGGKRLWTSQMMSEIQNLLPTPWRRYIQTADNVDAVDTATLTPGINVICLHEVDEPLFAAPMSRHRLAILQSLLISSRNLLWMTTAGRSQSQSQPPFDPRAAMFNGIARVVPSELPHLQVQVLGLEAGATPATVAARQCFEAFLRLRESESDGASDDHSEGAKSQVLWSHEPEVEVLANGQSMIPREVADKTLNERYNASRRAVTKTEDATDVAVQAVPGPTNKMILQEATDVDDEIWFSTDDELMSMNPKRNRTRTPIRVQVKYALHIPAKNGNSVYLVCGYRHPQDIITVSSPVFAISNVNASIVDVEREELMVAIEDHDCTPGALVSTACHMFVRAISILANECHSERQQNPCPVLLYAAQEPLAAMVAAELALTGKEHAYFASCSPPAGASGAWIKIYAGASKRATLLTIPRHVKLYVDCAEYYSSSSSAENPRGIKGTGIGDTLQACLPLACMARQLDGNLLHEALLVSGRQTTPTLLEESYLHIKGSSGPNTYDCKVIKAAELAGAAVSPLMQTRFVTDWQERTSLLLNVRPLRLNSLFRPNKTYLMVGCAGGVGLSLCQWMIRNGAKHIVITSRNPQVDASFLEDARLIHGASVQVVSMDVSSKDSVQSVVAQLVRNAANTQPFGGVCNAAMVLADRFFVDMTVDQLNNTLAPKVYGTEYLDAAFADTPLDFFIVLSSTAAVVGNVGQANYHAANLFMTSLVARRRSRGLAGSVVHIGHVADTGYVMREKGRRGLEQHFRDLRLMPLSETEVHHAFAEAVRGGKPGSSSGSHDIIMGLDPPTEPRVPGKMCAWLNNPRLAHFVPFSALQTKQQNRMETNIGGVRRRVEEAQTEDEAVSAVLEAFCSRLELILQLPAGSVGEDVRRAVIDLGIDSLVAVELRTWMLKDLGADMPVVKILGGDTVLQLCTLAAKKMMANIAKKTQQLVLQQDEYVNVKTSVGPTAATLAAPLTSDLGNPSPSHGNASPLSSAVLEITGKPLTPTGSSVFEIDITSSHSASSSGGDNSSETVASTSNNTELSDVALSSEGSSGCPAVENAEAEEEIGTVKPPPETTHYQRMSPAQSRIWFTSKHFLEDPAAYNMVFHYHVQGPLSMARLRHALHVATNHHECLRMRFFARPGDGVPMQGVMAASAYELKHVPVADKSDLHKEMAQLESRVWNLEYGNTFGVAVLSQNAEEHEIVFGFHHIVMDATGWYVFVRDLDRAYQMRLLEKSAASSILEYSALQLEQEKSSVFEEHLSFWQAEFETLPETLPLLPAFARVRTRPVDPTSQGSHHEMRELPTPQVMAIKETCQHLNISPFHLHLAVLQILLARHANTEDICLGIVDANRSDARFAQTVGCFINMLPIRFHVSTQATFANIAHAASRKALAAFSHGAVPLEMILDKANAPRSLDSTPLFQVAVNYRTGSIDNMPLGDECRMRLVGGKDAEDPYDISWGFVEGGGWCAVQMHCQAALYTRDACCAMVDEYLRLLERVMMDPNMPLEECRVRSNDIPFTVATNTATNGEPDRQEAISALPLQQKEAVDDWMMETEGELRLLWERVLPKSETHIIASSSDFFLSGGNSLLLVQLQAVIMESMGVTILTRVLYQASTLQEMARCIREEQTGVKYKASCKVEHSFEMESK